MDQRLVYDPTQYQHSSNDQYNAKGRRDLLVEQTADTQIRGGKQNRTEDLIHRLSKRRQCILTLREEWRWAVTRLTALAAMAARGACVREGGQFISLPSSGEAKYFLKGQTVIVPC